MPFHRRARVGSDVGPTVVPSRRLCGCQHLREEQLQQDGQENHCLHLAVHRHCHVSGGTLQNQGGSTGNDRGVSHQPRVDTPKGTGYLVEKSYVRTLPNIFGTTAGFIFVQHFRGFYVGLYWHFEICFLSTLRQMPQTITNISRFLRRFWQSQSFGIIWRIHFLEKCPFWLWEGFLRGWGRPLKAKIKIFPRKRS